MNPRHRRWVIPGLLMVLLLVVLITAVLGGQTG